MDTIDLTIDGAEAHVLEAALAIYRAQLHRARDLGGPATEAAALMDPIAARVQAKLHDALYGQGEPVEPDWTMPEGDDGLTRSKGAEDYWGGDHFVRPEDLNLEGLPEFNGAFGSGQWSVRR